MNPSYLARLDEILAVTEADLNRRRFLKSLGGAASAASNFNLNGVIKSMIGNTDDPFADVDDQELMSTPESKWITLIPYSRLLRIVKTPQYGGEVLSKIFNVLLYGPERQESFNYARLISRALKDAGVDGNVMASYFNDFAQVLANEEDVQRIAHIKGLELSDDWLDSKEDVVSAMKMVTNTFLDTAKDVGLDISHNTVYKIMSREINDWIDFTDNSPEELDTIKNKKQDTSKSKDKKPDSGYDDPYDRYLMSSMSNESGIGESRLSPLRIACMITEDPDIHLR